MYLDFPGKYSVINRVIKQRMILSKRYPLFFDVFIDFLNLDKILTIPLPFS